MKTHINPISREHRLPFCAEDAAKLSLDMDIKSIINQWMLSIYETKFGEA